MKNGKLYFSYSEEETQKIAAGLALELKSPSIVALHGNLGDGKTVFARGFARGLGINDIICSPTFNIIREYPFRDDSILYHMDLYRIADSETAMTFGIEEYLNNANAISLIEWPERISDILPANTIIVELLRVNDSQREITITFP